MRQLFILFQSHPHFFLQPTKTQDSKRPLCATPPTYSSSFKPLQGLRLGVWMVTGHGVERVGTERKWNKREKQQEEQFKCAGFYEL